MDHCGSKILPRTKKKGKSLIHLDQATMEILAAFAAMDTIIRNLKELPAIMINQDIIQNTKIFITNTA